MKRKIGKIILKSLLLIAIIGAIAGIGYLVLRLCGFTTVEDFTRLRDELGDTFGFWAIVTALQIFQAIFIQLSNSLITAPISLLFNNELWKVFLSSFIGVFIGNVALYFIGRFCGGKLLKWVLGDEATVEKLKVSMQNGKWFYLVGCVCPFIPSDVLNVLAGTSKYNAAFVIVSTFVTRAICVATTTWIVGLIPTYPWVIAILITLIVTMLAVAFFVTRKQLKNNVSSGINE